MRVTFCIYILSNIKKGNLDIASLRLYESCGKHLSILVSNGKPFLYCLIIVKYKGHVVFLFQCLHFLHTHKVIHRDLKAGNLLLTSDGNIKLGMLCLRVIILLHLHTGIRM